MFDDDRPRPPLEPIASAEGQEDDFAKRCREPAERWVLARRRSRPEPPQSALPRAVAG